MQDLKRKDQIAGHENAGPENTGPNGMKMQDLKMQDLLGMRRAFVVRY